MATMKARQKPLDRPSLDRVDRSSFSSVKENAGVVQSFTASKTSSYLRNKYEYSPTEEAVEDSPSVGSVTPPSEDLPSPLTNPHSILHGYVCPCSNFKGWKSISVAGKVASKSSSDLRSMRSWESWGTQAWTTPMPAKEIRKLKPGQNLPGRSPLESLPMEILGKFLTFYNPSTQSSL